MRRLVYTSHTPRPLSMQDRIDILRTAQARNQPLGITGVLLQSDNVFLQLLEGPREAVDTLYRGILRDPRHRDAIRLIDIVTSDQAPLLPGWRMGFFHLSSTSDLIGDPILRNDDQDFLGRLAQAPSGDPVASLLTHFWHANRDSLQPSRGIRQQATG